MSSVARREPPQRPSPGQGSATRVLVVDRDREMREALRATLARAGYAADMAGTAAGALRHAITTEYCLIVLDLVLPDADGLALLDDLLAVRPRQVVMVLSQVSDTATKVRCLEKGARDYLTKPFSPRELLARVHLRLEPFSAGWNGHDPRGYGRPPAAGASGHAAARRPDRAGRLYLDVGHLTADAGSGPVQLTRTEFLLLAKLAEHTGRPIPRQRLLTEVWGYGSGTRSNVVDVCVRRLRSKLGRSTIETVRRQGYRLGGHDEPTRQRAHAHRVSALSRS